METGLKKQVYRAINEVCLAISKIGVEKNDGNNQLKYRFRSIDDIYNSLAPILAASKLLILPNILSRDVTEKTSKSGSAVFYVVVSAEFNFVSAEDGSTHTVKTFGEGMDCSDKATNKAMTAAYKYACIQAFCIPTHGDNDGDASTIEIQQELKKTKEKKQPEKLITSEEITASQAKLESCQSLEELRECFKCMPDEHRQCLTEFSKAISQRFKEDE